VFIQGLGLWLDTPTRPLIAPFNYAVRLLELPQGVFGISLATFLLPTLSGLAAEKNFSEFRSVLRQGAAHLILVNLLMSVLLVTLAEPIIRLLFERGRFGPDSTLRAAFALECLGPSLVAYSLVNVLARAFYALGDTSTPMKISMVCLALNLTVALCLVWPFRQGGLGLANTASSAGNVVLLLYALRRKLGKLEMESLRATLLPLAVAGALAAIIAWWGGRFWELKMGHDTVAQKIGAVFVPGAVAGVIYWLIALGGKVPAATEITALVFRAFRGGPDR
jgi:putative peptidoglycan lipid II flippase